MSSSKDKQSLPPVRGLDRRQFLEHVAGTTFAVAALGICVPGCGECPESTLEQGTGSTPAKGHSTPAQTVFIPDVYNDSTPTHGWQQAWTLLAQSHSPRFHGAILKATQGTDFAPKWFNENWPRLRDAGGERYGQTWFRGAYHYLDIGRSPSTPPSVDGKAQAEFFLQHVDDAGGWSYGDLPPAVDVEKGDRNIIKSAKQVVDTTLAWAEHVKRHLGCKVMLYGHELMRTLHITSHMGCDFLWTARYGYYLDDNKAIGWPDDLVMFWQYTNGTTDDLPNHPREAPGLGSTSISEFQPYSKGTISEPRQFVRENGPKDSARRKSSNTDKRRGRTGRNR